MQEYVTELLQKWRLHPYLWNLLLFGAAILLGLVINLVLSFIIKKQTHASGFVLKRAFFRHLIKPLSFFIPLFILNLFLPVLKFDAAIMGRIGHAVEIALIVSFAWILTRAVRVVQDFIHNKVDIRSVPDNLRQRRLLTQLMYIRRVIIIIILLLTTGAVLLTFDTMRKLGTGLLTGVGVGGIIIGFAAQRSLGNLLAGFQIAFTQPIRIDDEVVVKDEFGTIEEITLTYVVVKVWDERRLILPINYFIEQPFENWTRSTSAMHGTVFIYSDYSLPIDWLRAEFRRLVQGHPLWDGRTASIVVTELKQDVMEIRALVSAGSSGQVFDLRCYLREQLIKAIAEYYPQCLPVTRAVLQKDEEKKP
ncbi:MAG TPA: mechanosensitive ion channel domain-containing protein [Flavisolibacter sp.]